MADLETLQDRLRRNPDDWDSWLVYADWLTDQDDGRGQMIVLEHQLATSTLGPLERRETRQRLVALQALYQPEKLADWACPEGTALTWRHGFVIGVRFPREPGWAEALQSLVLHHPAGSMVGALGLPSHALGTEGLPQLLASPALPRLKRLNLWGNRLDAEAAALLSRCAALSSLLSLSLWNNQLGNDGAAVLAESSALTALAELDLGDNRLSRDAGHALASAASLRSLRVLRLRRNAITEDAAAALAHSSALALTELDVGDNGLSRGMETRLQSLAPPGRRIYAD